MAEASVVEPVGEPDLVLRRATIAAACWLVAYSAAVAAVQDDTRLTAVVSTLVFAVPIAVLAALGVRAAARVRGPQRAAWRLLAVSNLLWLGAVTASAVYVLVLGAQPPMPSIVDGLQLASAALLPPAVIILFRRASLLRRARAVLDASLVTAAVGLVGWQLLIAPQLTGARSLATLTLITHPLMGVLVLVTLLSLGFSGHRNVPRPIALVGLGVAAAALVNAGCTFFVVLHGLVSPLWWSIGFQIQALLLGLAALAASRRIRDAEVVLLARDLGLAPALVGTACAVALLARDLSDGVVDPAVGGLGLFTVAGVLLRLWLTGRDKDQVARRLDAALREQERLAVTDSLTGLYNRRFIEEFCAIEGDRSRRAGGHLGLLLVDVDRFKRVNDELGHQAGDAVLTQVAQRLRLAVRTCDVVARHGGEEFLAVLPGADSEILAEVAERVRRAVGEHPVPLEDGRTLRVTVSVGGATSPEHAEGVEGLLQVADQALYAAKDGGRDRVVIGEPGDVERATESPADLGVVTLLERIADVVDARQGADEHSAAVARWAGVVADALDLSSEQRRRTVLAARLHDIGKLTVPEGILAKAAPLDAGDWQAVRTHPAAGGALLEGLPGLEGVGELVAAHHERPDGTGYPLGVRQASLAVGILAVCDAWAAMRARRHYGEPLSTARARDELLAGRGRQFDARAVDAFLRLEQAGMVGALASTAELLPAAR